MSTPDPLQRHSMHVYPMLDGTSASRANPSVPAGSSQRTASSLEPLVQIDEANSWHEERLEPEDTYELPTEPLKPRSLAIRVPKLTTKVTGFVFPEARQWIPETLSLIHI